jgi:hypothetical protein
MSQVETAFDGNFQFAWDSTSLKAFKKCPRYYYYSILCGYRPLEQSPHLTFGIAYHSALEALDHIKVKREATDEDLYEIVRATLLSVGKRGEDGAWVPWESGHEKKNLESLVRTVIFYFEQFRNDAVENVTLANGRAAVELSFRYNLPTSVQGVQAQYSGHLDKLCTFGGQTYFLDRKTTGSYLNERYFKQFSPDVQMTGYTFAGQIALGDRVVGGIVDAAQIGVGFTRFARDFITRTEEQLEEWLTDTCLSIRQAEMFAQEGYWPLNETACANYGGCQFQEICGRSPTVRPNLIATRFVVERWDPLASRGVTE